MGKTSVLFASVLVASSSELESLRKTRDIPVKLGSLFSGIGGFELGMERSGFEVAWQAECDKQARSVLAKHWPDVYRYKDVCDVRNAEPVDVICGGFPCQDYSIAGDRDGLAGDRGALWWEMHRIITDQRPTWVVAENVPGMLSSRGGRDFLEIVRSLVQLRYGITWATLDSQYFGVPQRRRRLFIIGHSGGVPRPEILAIGQGLQGDFKEGQRKKLQNALLSSKSPSFSSEKRVDINTDPIAFHPKQNPISGKLSPCMGTKGPMGVYVTVPRVFTPVESERLQSFPDNWTKYDKNGAVISDTDRWKFLGNAVTVNVAEWIGRQIIDETPTEPQGDIDNEDR